jgi:hypothetical protein
MSAEAELAPDASQMHSYPRMETPYVKALMARVRTRESEVAPGAPTKIERRRRERYSHAVTSAIARRGELQRQGYVAGGPAAFGYERKRRAKDGIKVLVRREPEASLLVQAFERAAAQQSLQQISDWFESVYPRSPDGRMKRWGRSKVSAMLRSRIYIAIIGIPGGEAVKGQHEPLVSQALWDKAQKGLANRIKRAGVAYRG